MVKENLQLQKKLLMKLLKNRVLGANHLRLQTILHGFPRHEIGDLKQAVDGLLKKGFLVWYGKSKQAIQANKERREEIRAFLMEQS